GRHDIRAFHKCDTTPDTNSRILRRPQLREKCGHRSGPVGEPVLFGERHFREGLARALRDEDGIEAEAPGPGFAGCDRPGAFAVKHLVRVALAEQEDRLECRRAGLAFGEETEDARASEALVNVRGVDAGEAAEAV